MNAKDAIRFTLGNADFLVGQYLSDITQQELVARATPDANHIAWQLGHLISAECRLVEAATGLKAALPEGFAERHSKETAASDNAADFLSKEEYLALAKNVRAATLKALESVSEGDLDKPVSGRVPPFVKTAGDCFILVGNHWILHAGQWVVLRRQLNRPRQF